MASRKSTAVSEPFDALVPYEIPSAELRFAELVASAEVIGEIIADLVSILVDALRARGLGARVVRLECDRVDGVPQVIAVGMARATRDPEHLLRLLAMRIETIEPGFGIDAMRLVAVRAEPQGAVAIEGDLGGDERTADVGLLVDQLVVRLGASKLYRSTDFESDVPERSVRRTDPLDRTEGLAIPWPRPVRMLARPERLDNVVALLPDQPPRRFTWRGQGTS